MSFSSRSGWTSLGLVVGLWTAGASAQSPADAEVPPDHDAAEESGESDGAALPLRLTERPLTLPRGKVVLTSGLALEHMRADLDIAECVDTISGLVCTSDSSNRSESTPETSAGVTVGVIDALFNGLRDRLAVRRRWSQRPDPEPRVTDGHLPAGVPQHGVASGRSDQWRNHWQLRR